jgi:hypothetical protein
MTAHAKLSASGSSRWLNCPGSVKAEEGFPDKSSSFADEGTVAHATAEAILLGANPSDLLGTYPEKTIDIPVTQEMLDYVQVYVDYVNSIKGERMIEVRVDFSDLVPEGFGTSDAIIIDGDTLHDIDLKYGKGVLVYAKNNSQAMLYALGALSDFGAIYDIKVIKIAIVQPRLDNISEWEISVQDLLKWGHWVSERAQLALTDNAPRSPSEKACQWCKAKATCAELLNLTHNALASEFDDLSDVHTLSDAQLAFVLENKKLIESWLTAVEDLIEDRLLSGGEFPNYKLVAGRSTRSWSDESGVESILTEALGEAAYVKKLLTPAAAEKALGKTKAKLIVDYVSKPEGKPTIAHASDKRPALGVSADSFECFGE